MGNDGEKKPPNKLRFKNLKSLARGSPLADSLDPSSSPIYQFAFYSNQVAEHTNHVSWFLMSLALSLALPFPSTFTEVRTTSTRSLHLHSTLGIEAGCSVGSERLQNAPKHRVTPACFISSLLCVSPVVQHHPTLKAQLILQKKSLFEY